MARFRDVKDLTVFGTSFTGVQGVTAPISADSFDYSADDNSDIRRVDVTKRAVEISVEIRDPLFKRDIKDPVWGPGSGQVALNEVTNITLTEEADTLEDSAEDDTWLTYIGVTKRAMSGEIDLRDISQLLENAAIYVGAMESFQFDVLPGAALTGLQNRTAYERFLVYRMVITGISPGLTHGEIASGTMSLRGSGDGTTLPQLYNTLSAGGASGFEIHPGDTGTISFTAPAAVGGSGGNKNVSVANCVCTKAEITATHGGGLVRTFDFKAYSADGQTSPITVT